MPLDRWDTDWLLAEAGSSGRGRAAGLSGHFGTFVSGWAEFDAAVFSLPPTEVHVMDPQQRVLLEVWFRLPPHIKIA